MNILTCIKRVPDVGAKINLKEDKQTIDDKNLGFTISPHEEGCVQEAVNILAEREGESTVLSLGSKGTEDQLRDCLARGISHGVLLESDYPGWNPMQTATCLSTEISKLEQNGKTFDLILFGAESADLENAQVHLRVANALNRPCLSRVSGIEINEGKLTAKREGEEGIEFYEITLPAVLSVKDGINLPKHPSLRGTMAAKRKKIDIIPVQPTESNVQKIQFIPVEQNEQRAEILGEGAAAAPKIVELLKKLEIIS